MTASTKTINILDVLGNVKIVTLFVFLASILSCEEEGTQTKLQQSADKTSFGGALKIGVHQNDLSELDLHNKLSHLNLLSLSKKDMEAEASVFSSWYETANDTSFNFIISETFRNGSADGPIVQAEDVVFSLWLSYLKMDDENELRFFDFLKGELPTISTDVNDSVYRSDFPSITIKNDSVINFKLVHPIKWFPEILAAANIPLIKYSAFVKTGNYSGIGPFVLVDKTSSVIVYAKNPDYLGLNGDEKTKPYLDSIIVQVYSSRNQALNDFEVGQIDLLYGVPVRQARAFVEEYIKEFEDNSPIYNFDRFPEMSVYFYQLAVSKTLVSNSTFRHAIALGIDREMILKDAIFDEAYSSAKNGVSPPIFRDYDQKALGYVETDETQANILFQSMKAGLPEKTVPNVTVSVIPLNDKSLRTGLEVQRQLYKKFGIQAELNEIGASLDAAKCDLSFGQVKAYFNSPISVLVQFMPYYHSSISAYSGKEFYSNSIRNSKFNETVLLALETKDHKQHSAFCLMAEKILLEENLIMPLWYGEKYRLIKSKVKNFKHNRFNIVDFSSIYLSEN